MASNDFFIKIVLDAESKIAPVLAAAAAQGEKLQGVFDRVDRSAQKLDRHVEQLDGHVAKMRDTIRFTNPTMEAMQGKLVKLSSTLSDTNREAAKTPGAFAKFNAALESAVQLIERMENKLDHLDRKMAEMGAKQYKTEIEVETAKSEAKVASLTERLAAATRGVHTAKTDVEIGAALAKVQALREELEKLGHGQRAERIIIEVNSQEIDDAAHKLRDLSRQKGGSYTVNVRDQQVDALIVKLAAATRASYRFETEVETAKALRDVERFRQSLQKLGAGDKADRLVMEIDANVDRKKADADLKALTEQLREMAARPLTIRTAVTGEADREMDDIRRQMLEIAGLHVDANIGLDDGVARAQLALLEERLLKLGLKKTKTEVVVDVDRSVLDRLGSYFQQKGGEFSSRCSAGFSGLTAKLRDTLLGFGLVFIEPLLSVLTALGGALIAVGASAGVAVVGLVGLANAAIFQATPAIGLLILGLARVAAVSKVASLAQAERDKGGTQSAAIDNARAGALDTLANAQQGVVDAQDRLAESQRALDAARREGLRTLQDMLLAEQRAALAAQKSSLGLANTIASGTGGLVQEAQLENEGNQIASTRATEDRQAVGGNVENLPAVMAARKALSDAADGVERARKQVDQAQRGLDQASQKIGAAASAYGIALGKLSDSEKKLLGSIERIKKLYADTEGPLRKVSDAIVNGFANALDSVTDMLQDSDVLKSFQGLADAIGKMISDIAEFLTTGPMREAWKFFADEATSNIPTVTSILENLLTILVNLARAASGALSTGLEKVDGWLERVAKKTGTLEGQKKLSKWFDDSLDSIRDWLKLGGAVIRLFGALAGPGGAAEEGNSAVERLTDNINKATKYVEENGDKVRDFLRESIDVMAEVGGVIITIGAALVDVFDPESVKQFAEFLKLTVIPVLAGFVKAIGFITRGLLEIANNPFAAEFIKWTAYFIGFGLAAGKVGAILGGVMNIVGGLLKFVGRLLPLLSRIPALFTLLLGGARTLIGFLLGSNPFGWAILAVTALVVLYKKVEWFRNAVDKVIGFIKDNWEDIGLVLLGPIGWLILLVKHFDKVKDAARDVVAAVKRFFGKGFADRMGDLAKDAASAVVKAFIGVGTKIIDLIKQEIKDGGGDISELITNPAGYFGKKVGDAISGGGGDKDDKNAPTPKLGTTGIKIPEIKITTAPKAAQKPEKVETVTAYAPNLGAIDLSPLSKAYTKLINLTRDQADKIADQFSKMRSRIASTLDGLASKMRKTWHSMIESLDTNMDRFEDRWAKGMDNIADTTFAAFKYILDATNKSLKAFGAEPVKLSLAAPEIKADKKATGGVVGAGPTGFVGLPGERGKDAVPTWLGRGEVVLNWGHQKLVNAAMKGQDTLAGVLGRSNSFHAGGPEQPGYASGGGPFGSAPAFTPIANFAKEKFGLTMTSGKSNHSLMTASGNISDHSKGLAGDFSNGVLTPQEDAFNAFLLSKIPQTIKQLIWRNKDQQRGFPVSGHEDHVHYAIQPQFAQAADKMAKILSRAMKGLSIDSLLAGASGDEVDHIQTPKINGRGAGKAMLDKIVKKVTGGANKHIDSEASKNMGNIVGQSDVTSTNFSGAWVERMAQLANKFNWKLSDWKQLVQGESGGDPKATNPSSGAFGLGQFLGSTKTAYAKYGAASKDPVRQIEAMAKYISDRYRNPTNAYHTWLSRSPHWYAKGGVVGEGNIALPPGVAWGGYQAEGGDYLVKKPTAFIAGEAGDERATFTKVKKTSNTNEALLPTNVDLKGLIKSLFAKGVKSADFKKTVEEISDVLGELSVGELKTLRDKLKREIGKSKKGTDRYKQLTALNKDVVEYIDDPLKMMTAQLGRLTDPVDVSVYQRMVDRVVKATVAVDKKFGKGIEKFSKTLDFLAADTGPFAALEARIQAKASAAARALSKSMFKVGKDGTVDRKRQATDNSVANEEVDSLMATRSGYQDELGSVNALIDQAQKGLKNATTEKQRERFRGSINNLKTRRETVRTSISDAEASIIQRREQQQQDNLTTANSVFDRARGLGSEGVAGIAARRRLAAVGGPGTEAGFIGEERKIAQQQVGDLTNRLKDAKSTGNTSLADQIMDQLKELQVAIVEMVSTQIKAVVDEINKFGEQARGDIDIQKRITAVTSGIGDGSSFIDRTIQATRDQIAGLWDQMGAANNAGDTKLAGELGSQINDLTANIYELADQKIQAMTAEVDRQASRREAGFSIRGRLADLQARMGDAMGALQARGNILKDQGGSLAQQREGLVAALREAERTGNNPQIESLNDRLAELDTSIKENTQSQVEQTFAVRKLSVDIINGVTSRTTGLIGQGGSIMDTLSAIDGTSGKEGQATTLQGIGVALKKQFDGILGQIADAINKNEFGSTGSGILSQLGEAAKKGPAEFAKVLQNLAPAIAEYEKTLGPEALGAFQGLVDGLTSNEIAIVGNTQAIKALDNQVAQTFSTTAWTMFRQGIFNGTGGILPQYDIPQMHTGGYVTKTGMFELEAGERVLTPSQINSGGNTTNVDVHITNPTDVFDPDHAGKVIAWNINGSGRNN